MRTWGSAIFPVTLMAALTGLTFWLRYATELPEGKHDGKNRHDPDYIVTDATLRKIDLTGTLKYTLKAAEVRHYPDDDTTDVLTPDVLSLNPTKPPVSMTADRGHLSKDGNRIDLYGNVKVVRAASAKFEELTAETPDLTVLPDDDKAFTKSPVLITQGKSWVKGVGMQLNSKEQTYVLESQVLAEIESKFAKKKKP